jgi:hypothetical protein
MATPLDTSRRRFRDSHTRRALDELRHEVARTIRQVGDQMDDAGGDDGGSDPELSALFAALRGLLDEIDSKISRNAVLDDLEARGARPRDRADRGFDTTLLEFSIRGMLAAAIGHPIPGLDLGRSVEISQELRRRTPVAPQGFWAPIEALYLERSYARKLERRDTISTGLPAGGPGGSLIPLTLDAARYIDALRARTVVIQAGAQTINDLVGSLDIPKMKQTGQVAWFNEGDTISQSNEQFDRVSFRPKHCGSIISYSRNMLLQSTPSIEMIIRDDLSRLLALDMDRVAMTGSGEGAEPLGLARNPLVTKITPTDFEYLNNVELRRQICSKNVPLESLAFLGNSQVDAWSLSALDAMSRPLGRDLVFLGLPFYTSNIATAAAVTGPPALPAILNPLFIGAWSEMYITYWSQLDLLANALSDTAFTTASVQVRALMTADVNVRHPEAFAWQDATTGPTLPPLVAGAAATGGAAAHTQPERRRA